MWIVVIPKLRGYARLFEKLCQLGHLRGLLEPIQIQPPVVVTIMRSTRHVCAGPNARRQQYTERCDETTVAYFLCALLC
jgi:hypothetical protein